MITSMLEEEAAGDDDDDYGGDAWVANAAANSRPPSSRGTRTVGDATNF